MSIAASVRPSAYSPSALSASDHVHYQEVSASSDGVAMTEGRTSITLPSRPSNDASLDMGRPPQTSRAYSRTGRAALTAGTLTPVGDNTARQDVHGNVEVRHPDGYYPDVMPSDHEPREWYDEAELLRQSRLRRWQAIR